MTVCSLSAKWIVIHPHLCWATGVQANYEHLILTGNTYGVGQCSTSVCSRWVATVRTLRCTLHLLEVSLRLCWVRATATRWLYPPEELAVLSWWWVIAYSRSDHLCNNWMILFVLHDPGDCLDESIGSFHQRFSLCEWPIKYDGNEHLSVFLMRLVCRLVSAPGLLLLCFHKGSVPTPL